MLFKRQFTYKNKRTQLLQKEQQAKEWKNDEDYGKMDEDGKGGFAFFKKYTLFSCV